MMRIKSSYSSKGIVESIHFNRGTELVPMWASLPFDPFSKKFIPNTELEQQLLDEAQQLSEWATLDLSDRPPTLKDDEPIPPNWSDFRKSILADPNYQSISNTTLDQRSVTRLESAATIKSDDWGALRKFWNSIIQYAPNKPSKSAIATWNEIASINNMPFSFDDNGLLIAPVPQSDIPIPPPPEPIILPIQIPYSTSNLQATLDQLLAKVAIQQAQITLLTPTLKPPLIEDSFTSLLDIAIDSRLPDINQGSRWVKRAGNWLVSNGSAKSDGTAASLTWIECGKSDKLIVESDVFLVDTNVSQGLIFRFNSTNNYHWRAVYTKSKWEILEVTNTVSSRATFPEAIAFNQLYRFKVLLDGSTLTLFVNGAQKCSWISSNNLNETKMGLYASSSIATKFDSFKVIGA